MKKILPPLAALLIGNSALADGAAFPIPPGVVEQAYSSFESKAVLDKALRKAGKTKPEELFALIHACAQDSRAGAAVTQAKRERTFFLPRDLEELAFEPKGQEGLLEGKYRDLADKIRAKQPLSGTNPRMELSLQTDLVRVHEYSIEESICIKSDVPKEQVFEVLMHELTHYVSEKRSEQEDDIASFENLNEYASKVVNRPGDEVDAYILETLQAMRIRGAAALDGYPWKSLFTGGFFNGDRAVLAQLILDSKQYRTIRFLPEYQARLTLARDAEDNRQQTLIDLVNFRTEQEAMYIQIRNGRVTAAVQQAPNTQKAEKLAKTAGESRSRILQEMGKSTARRALLQRKLDALSALAGN